MKNSEFSKSSSKKKKKKKKEEAMKESGTEWTWTVDSSLKALRMGPLRVT